MASETGIVQRTPVMDAIEKAKNQLGGRLPEGMTQERFVYGLMTSVQKNSDLLKCNPTSVLLAAYEAAECGCDLSPSKALGWLIPYRETCQFQPSWRFFVQKAYASGIVKAFNAEVVYLNDKFKIVFAPVRTVIHEPALGDRGKPVGAYALIQFKSDAIDFEFLTLEEIENHRGHSKMPNSLMWKDFWNEGARKTAIRVLAKRLPHTNPAMEKLAEIVQKDADEDLDVPTGAIELEKDSPLTRAVIPPMPDISMTNYSVVDAAENPVTPRLFVNFHVGKDRTRITGQTQRIEKGLRKLFAERSKDGRAWEISSSSTEPFLKLCEDANVSAIEVDEQDQPMAPATMLDLYGEQDS